MTPFKWSYWSLCVLCLNLLLISKEKRGVVLPERERRATFLENIPVQLLFIQLVKERVYS